MRAEIILHYYIFVRYSQTILSYFQSHIDIYLKHISLVDFLSGLTYRNLLTSLQLLDKFYLFFFNLIEFSFTNENF